MLHSSIPAVIMAGGKGTRLASITGGEIPKPMVRIAGKPILEHQIAVLKENGIKEIYLIIGHLGNRIEEYFQDGSAWGVHIMYIREEEPLGTAGALYYMKERITGNFLLVFGDIIFDIDVQRFLAFHSQKNALVTLYIHPNAHPFDSDLVIVNNDGLVTGIDSKHNVRQYYYQNLVNSGLYVINTKALHNLNQPVKTDLEKDIIRGLIEDCVVYGYHGTEYVHDIGTPQRLRSAEHDMNKCIISAHNLKKPQKCIFLDRDGVINQYAGLVYKPEQFALESGAAQAIRQINQSQYLVMVVTNQPVVARGMCGLEDIVHIHNKMETLLGQEHAYLDAIRFCPHHPDKGYPEENPLYKIECNCRKPQIGMIEELADRYHIDLLQSWMIGDSTVDVMTGINAHMHTILVQTGLAGEDGKYNVQADRTERDLQAAVQGILGE